MSSIHITAMGGRQLTGACSMQSWCFVVGVASGHGWGPPVQEVHAGGQRLGTSSTH